MFVVCTFHRFSVCGDDELELAVVQLRYDFKCEYVPVWAETGVFERPFNHEAICNPLFIRLQLTGNCLLTVPSGQGWAGFRDRPAGFSLQTFV
ncbi:unnamed protein product [Protopolystoma xenopodis]|uniref:Uncharacterized protein n=1 Tax=Protopolystoma xenopodis TaxID=117903 RepID=A0A3S5CQF3_9PLAT|nr:unnamed protein product [Protopolystoma xenopodis]